MGIYLSGPLLNFPAEGAEKEVTAEEEGQDTGKEGQAIFSSALMQDSPAQVHWSASIDLSEAAKTIKYHLV